MGCVVRWMMHAYNFWAMSFSLSWNKGYPYVDDFHDTDRDLSDNHGKQITNIIQMRMGSYPGGPCVGNCIARPRKAHIHHWIWYHLLSSCLFSSSTSVHSSSVCTFSILKLAVRNLECQACRMVGCMNSQNKHAHRNYLIVCYIWCMKHTLDNAGKQTNHQSDRKQQGRNSLNYKNSIRIPDRGYRCTRTRVEWVFELPCMRSSSPLKCSYSLRNRQLG